MKFLYFILILLIFCSCKQNIEEKKIESIEIESAVEAAAEPSKHTTTTFKEELLKLKLKNVPLIDSSSFDNHTDKGDYQKINTEALKLAKVYKNWNNLKSNYRIIDAYRLKLSKDFYTVVVTALKSDEELESRLINYDIEGNVIASEMVAYDSKTEDWTKTKSTIETDRITINYQYKVSKETGIIKIEPYGKFRMLGLSDIFYELVIDELNIDRSKLIPSLQAFKILPNRPHEAVVVIPEIVEGSEEEHYFSLNTHIAYVNIENKQVLFHYFESAKTNGWTSDAIVLQEIVIDTAPFTITESKRAFGVKTHFVGSSRVNPYESEQLSLFIVANNNVQKVLHNFEVKKGSGEINGACDETYLLEEKTLIISKEKTNAYFDIVVNNKTTNSILFKNENDDCDEKEDISTKTSVLKLDGAMYK
ncbi:hypothetical protein [Flexithrix dorotheae]|uniref:hypothetical protein n=1 Tax=Flexithrix dorotheae TaxID=70993 RepID=UPI000372E04A|nr:hypothetical protein [Flexithrix dorotheae]